MTLNNKHLKSKIDFLHEDFLKEQQAEKGGSAFIKS